MLRAGRLPGASDTAIGSVPWPSGVSAIAVLVLSLRGEERVQAQQASNVERSAQAPSWLTRRRWRWWWCSGLLVLPWFAALRGQLSVSPDAGMRAVNDGLPGG